MDDQQLLRYNRHIMLPEIDVAGQERLLASTVLVLGLGGLGSPVALYLAASGIGHLILADHDTVDLSNLQRQIIHGEADVQRSKVSSALDSIGKINSTVKLTGIEEKLIDQRLAEVVKSVDLVLDCSDNFATRFSLNRICVAAKIPLVSGAAIRTEGQVAVFDSRFADSPCYRCLYSDEQGDENLSCSESGILAPVVGLIGTFQALAAIRLLVREPGQAGDHGLLHIFDANDMAWRRLILKRDPHCPVCGN